MPQIELFREAERRAEARKAVGDYFLELAKMSLSELVSECGGQVRAAKLLTMYYGQPFAQGTISKALNGNPVKVRDQLRLAIHDLSAGRRSGLDQTKMLEHFLRLPVYHDIVKVDGEYALYLGCTVMGSHLIIHVLLNKEFQSVKAERVELI